MWQKLHIHTYTNRKVFSSGKSIPSQWLNFIIKGWRNWRNSHSEKSPSNLLLVTYFPLTCRGTAKVLSRGTDLSPLSRPKESIKESNFYFNSYLGSECHKIILQREESLALKKSLLIAKHLLTLSIARCLEDKAMAAKPKMSVLK